MPASSLGARVAFATAVFFALLALLFTFPAVMAGDMQAFRALLAVGGALSLALLVCLLLIALPTVR